MGGKQTVHPHSTNVDAWASVTWNKRFLFRSQAFSVPAAEGTRFLVGNNRKAECWEIALCGILRTRNKDSGFFIEQQRMEVTVS